ncbi:MAG TPA: DUF6786 family protein [Planctomycetota bacterium]|nr:DUF6786 family protein [Planctomycetota bacterium]
MSLRIALAVAAAALGGCASQTFIDDVNFLDRHTEILRLQPDRTSNAEIVVCPRLQGRVMTSTAAGPGGLSYGWINRNLIASGEMRPHINAYGGEDRFWLGPEGGQFSIFFAKGDPQDLAHWQTPAAVDSESFDVARRGLDSCLLRKRMKLTNASGALFELELQREIRCLGPKDPGRMLGIEPTSYVRWVGYQSRNKITNTGDREWKQVTGLLSAWILGMYNPSPGTTVVLPFKQGPEDQLGPVVNDAYFGKVPADRLKIGPGVLFFKGDGLRRGKIGLSPRRSLGVLGSYDAENETLTIVQFHQPKGELAYVNSMWELQKDPYSGDAANSYNDGPASPEAAPLGPFYELESSSPALALKPGIAYTHVHTTFHFQGPLDELDAIASRVLGVGLTHITEAFAGTK